MDSAFSVYERLVCGIVLPFVLLAAWLGPVMEDVIREVAPASTARPARRSLFEFGLFEN